MESETLWLWIAKQLDIVWAVLLVDVKVSSSQIEIGTMINIHLNFCLLHIDLWAVFAIVNILQYIKKRSVTDSYYTPYK